MAERLLPPPAPRSPDIAAAKDAISARKSTWAKARERLADWLPISPQTRRIKKADEAVSALHTSGDAMTTIFSK